MDSRFIPANPKPYPMSSVLFRTSCAAAVVLAAISASQAADLKAPADFSSIADETERSTALFTEIGKVRPTHAA